MENNKRTIDPISPEDDIRASLGPTPGLGMDKGDFKNAKNEPYQALDDSSANSPEDQQSNEATIQNNKKHLNRRLLFIPVVILVVLLSLGGYGIMKGSGGAKSSFKTFNVDTNGFSYSVKYYSNAKDTCFHDCNESVAAHGISAPGSGSVSLYIESFAREDTLPQAMRDYLATDPHQCPNSSKTIVIKTAKGDVIGCISMLYDLVTNVKIGDYWTTVRFAGNKYTNFDSMKDDIATVVSSLKITKVNAKGYSG